MLLPVLLSSWCCGRDVLVCTRPGHFCQVYKTSRRMNHVVKPEAYAFSERSKKLPTGLLNWIKPFWRNPDTLALDHSSLDGFLFLRFVKILIVVFFVGCCLTWPVLLPLHATGGGEHVQLDKLTFGNITNPRKYYAHALLAWIYFGRYIQCVTRTS